MVGGSSPWRFSYSFDELAGFWGVLIDAQYPVAGQDTEVHEGFGQGPLLDDRRIGGIAAQAFIAGCGKAC
jgi:hypothetical protein